LIQNLLTIGSIAGRALVIIGSQGVTVATTDELKKTEEMENNEERKKLPDFEGHPHPISCISKMWTNRH
jgi:hypothetical protein